MEKTGASYNSTQEYASGLGIGLDMVMPFTWDYSVFRVEKKIDVSRL
jgi:hypothetical protein